jgi:LEA14-like dessication related protein
MIFRCLCEELCGAKLFFLKALCKTPPPRCGVFSALFGVECFWKYKIVPILVKEKLAYMAQTSSVLKPLLLVGGGILLYNFITKARGLGTAVFFPDKVESLQWEGATPVFTVSVLVQNTTSLQFVVKSIAGTVYSNGVLVGNVSMFTPVVVPANSQKKISLTVKFALIGIVQNIIDAFQTGNFSQDIVVEGYANVDNYQVPIKLPYKIGK